MSQPVVEKDTKTKINANGRLVRTLRQVVADANGTLPTRIMLLKTGEWKNSAKGELQITADNLRNYKTNFDNQIGWPAEGTGLAIDFKHEDYDEAACWIKAMEVEPSTDPVEAANGAMCLWATDLEWSDAGRTAILGKQFKCISPSFFPADRGGWEDPQDLNHVVGDVCVGAGLTNIPFFGGKNGLAPVLASNKSEADVEQLTDPNIIFMAKKKETPMPAITLDDLRSVQASAITDEHRKFAADHKEDLNAEERTKFGITEDKPAPVQASAQVTGEMSDDDRKILASVRSGEMKLISASRLAQMEDVTDSYRTEKAQAVVDAHIKRGAIKMDQRDRWTERLLKASTEERAELETDLKAMNGNEQLKASIGSNSGDTAKSATAQITASAQKMVDDKKFDNLGQAVLAARKADPDLAKQADEETGNN